MNTTLANRDYTPDEMAEALNALGECHREMFVARLGQAARNNIEMMPPTYAETQAAELLERYKAPDEGEE